MWDKLTDLIKTERPVTLAVLLVIGLTLVKQNFALEDLKQEVATLRVESWSYDDGNQLAASQDRWLRKYLRRANASIDDGDYFPNPWDVRTSK